MFVQQCLHYVHAIIRITSQCFLAHRAVIFVIFRTLYYWKTKKKYWFWNFIHNTYKGSSYNELIQMMLTWKKKIKKERKEKKSHPVVRFGRNILKLKAIFYFRRQIYVFLCTMWSLFIYWIWIFWSKTFVSARLNQKFTHGIKLIFLVIYATIFFFFFNYFKFSENISIANLIIEANFWSPNFRELNWTPRNQINTLIVPQNRKISFIIGSRWKAKNLTLKFKIAINFWIL